MKVMDLRCNNKDDIGNILETNGDSSLLCITTDKGYRLTIDTYNMKRIADYYMNKGKK